MELRIHIEPKYVYLPAGLFAGLCLSLAVTTMAEDTELDTGPRAIPYNGILEFNGQALNGQADLQFTLTDDPSGENINCEFSEEHDNVTAYSGRFSVNIGSVAGDLPDCVFDSDAMYIEVAVRDATANEDEDDTNDDYVALSGSQRIHPVPFSYWAAEGSDFKVDGDLTVNGDATVTNKAYVTGDGSNDQASLAGDGLLTLGEIDGINLTMDGNEIIARDNGANARLNLQQDGGDTRIGGDLDAQGDITVANSRHLYLSNDEDAAVDNDGALTIGDLSDLNLTMDGNEIIARDNGALSVLRLQQDGGSTRVGGDLSVHGDALDVRGEIYNTDTSSSEKVFINDGVEIANGLTVGSDGTGGITVNGDANITGTLTVGTQTLDNYIRSWVRSHCKIKLGWDGTGNSTDNPGRVATSRADGSCLSGQSDTCVNADEEWAAIDPNGSNIDDDYWYIRFECD